MQELLRWKGVRLEIAEYCRDNHISEEDVRLLNMYEWQNVYNKVLEHFVDERYARKCGLYWANIENGFRRDINTIYGFQEGADENLSYEWIERLPEIVKCEKVYLLLEEDNQHAKYWIAECNPEVVHLLINDTEEHADYYITDKKFNWLITENHHDFVKFLGEGLDAEIIKTVCTK